MPTLYVTARTLAPDRIHVQTLLEVGTERQRATSDFRMQFDPRDRERLRWYLEDYPEAPLDPHPQMAAGIERRLQEVGTDLFRAMFLADRDGQALWRALRGHLAETRVELSATIAAEAAVPWELLRDPATGAALALDAQAFVRVPPIVARRPFTRPVGNQGTVRVLLVVARPAGDRDVPFRSVAGRVHRLGVRSPSDLELEVLRPPTFAQLARTLQGAREAGQPYDVVHFDGHGVWLDAAEASNQGWSTVEPRPGRHGYLLFEDPEGRSNQQLVDGPSLGRLLAACEVPVLVLNACRSAHAEPVDAPDPDKPGARDVEGRVQAYGSLAYEALEGGAAGVVAMRYNVYASTAAAFVNDLYSALINSVPLGEASALARRNLASATLATDGAGGRVQDWMVPVVFEAPSMHWSRPSGTSSPADAPSPSTSTVARHGPPDTELPAAPEVGFQGRDDALLALDRGLDGHRVVLLHGPDGSGKSSTAAEFARWYRDTGGLRGPDGSQGAVVYTSLRRHDTAEQLLERVGEVLGQEPEPTGVDTRAPGSVEPRARTLRLLDHMSVLWIWDDLEDVTGTPGQPGHWSAPERQALRQLLERLSHGRAWILLLSTDEEQQFLGDLPLRVELRPMSMRDRLELARAVARKERREVTAAAQWDPLLRFGGGSPLVTRLVVQRALRLEAHSPQQLNELLAKLQSGQTELIDDQGKPSPLASSLWQVLTMFTAREQAMLALLHLFRTTVSLDAFTLVRDEAFPGSSDDGPPTPEEGRELLERASQVGLLEPLMPEGRMPGHYSIHPMLRPHLRRLFSMVISDEPRAVHAYADNMAFYGQFQADWFSAGEGWAPLMWLAVNEDNLRHARELGRAHGWPDIVPAAGVALVQLYEHTGRTLEHARILEELQREVTDPTTGGPLPGREEHWTVTHQLVVAQALASGNADGVEQVQREIVRRYRDACGKTVDEPMATLDYEQLFRVMGLIRALKQLGDVLLEQRRADCCAPYEEALTLAGRFDSPSDAAAIALHLGHAYLDIEALQDLDRAEEFYQLSLELRPGDDQLGRAKCLGQLGGLALRRLSEADETRIPPAEQHRLFRLAAEFLEATLRLLPPSAVRELQVTHHKLGDLYSLDSTRAEASMGHYAKALAYAAAMQDSFTAGKCRMRLATWFVHLERIDEAFQYASSAVEDFRRCGPNGAEDLKTAYGFFFAIPLALTARALKAEHEQTSPHRLQVLRDDAIKACRLALDIIPEQNEEHRTYVSNALAGLEGTGDTSWPFRTPDTRG